LLLGTDIDLKRIELTKLKTEEFTPTPTASERTATRVKPGFFKDIRTPKKRSRRKEFIAPPIVAVIQL
jgi:hypothetical protein